MDGSLVIDQWSSLAMGTPEYVLNAAAGEPYYVTLEYKVRNIAPECVCVCVCVRVCACVCMWYEVTTVLCYAAVEGEETLHLNVLRVSECVCVHMLK